MDLYTSGKRLVAVVIAGAALAAAGVAAAASSPPPSFFTNAAASAAPPPPCASPQIADPTGDGHHSPTDVTSAWLSEAAGKLQAVIKVNSQRPRPEHDDPDIEAGLAFLFTVPGGQTAYVRAKVFEDLSVDYDYGTYTFAGNLATFTSAGATDGVVEPSAQGGTVTIDVPAATGAVPGALLADPYVLTWDGFVGGAHVWVDHAPGGEVPPDPARGASYIVGECAALSLSTPAKRVGPGPVKIQGQILPAVAGVDVEITRTTFKGSVVSTVKTNAQGAYSLTFKMTETTIVKTAAQGLTSQDRKINMRTVTRITKVQRRGRITFVRGVVRPKLPGRLLLLKTTAFKPRAVKPRFAGGKYSFRVKNLKPGRYQVIFIPKNNRAVQSISKAARVRR